MPQATSTHVIEEFSPEIAGERVGVFYTRMDDHHDELYAGLVTATVAPEGAKYGYSSVVGGESTEQYNLKGDISGFTAVHGLSVAVRGDKSFSWVGGTHLKTEMPDGLQKVSPVWATGRLEIAEIVSEGFDKLGQDGEGLYPGFYYLFNKFVANADLRKRWNAREIANQRTQEEMFLVDPSMWRTTEERLEQLCELQATNERIRAAQNEANQAIEEANKEIEAQGAELTRLFDANVHTAIGGIYNRQRDYLPVASKLSPVTRDNEGSDRVLKDFLELQRLSTAEKKHVT